MSELNKCKARDAIENDSSFADIEGAAITFDDKQKNDTQNSRITTQIMKQLFF